MKNILRLAHAAEAAVFTMGDVLRGPNLANAAIIFAELLMTIDTGLGRRLASITQITNDTFYLCGTQIALAPSRMAAMTRIDYLATAEEKLGTLLLIMGALLGAIMFD